MQQSEKGLMPFWTQIQWVTTGKKKNNTHTVDPGSVIGV